MPSLRTPRIIAFTLVAFAFQLLFSARCPAQAALLMEEPYGFFGTVNPTGHTAIYLRISARRHPRNCAGANRARWAR